MREAPAGLRSSRSGHVNNLSGPVDNCVNNFCGETGGYRGSIGFDSPLGVPVRPQCGTPLTLVWGLGTADMTARVVSVGPARGHQYGGDF